MPVTKSVCPSCGAEIRQGMLRCRECGRPRGAISSATDAASKNSVSIQRSSKAITPHNPHSRAKSNDKSESSPRSNSSNSKTVVKPQVKQKPAVSASRATTQRRHISQPQQPWYRSTVALVVATFLCSATAIAFAINVQQDQLAPVEELAGEIDLTPDRAAAIWVVENYGVVTVEMESGTELKFVARKHLPLEPFKVVAIDLWHQKIEGSELVFLRDLTHLRSLDLSHSGIMDEHMHLIGQATNLNRLALRGGKVSAEGYRQLPLNLNMTNFTASANHEFTDETLSIVAEKMPNLRLFLCASTQVTDEGFAQLSKLPNLRDVRVQKTEVSDAAIASLKEQLPKCKITK